MIEQRFILKLSGHHARLLYYLLWLVPGSTAKEVRTGLGHILKATKK